MDVEAGAVSQRTMPYGMPSSLMQGLKIKMSTFFENLRALLPPLFPARVAAPIQTPQQSLTNASLAVLRQQLEDINH